MFRQVRPLPLGEQPIDELQRQSTQIESSQKHNFKTNIDSFDSNTILFKSIDGTLNQFEKVNVTETREISKSTLTVQTILNIHQLNGKSEIKPLFKRQTIVIQEEEKQQIVLSSVIQNQIPSDRPITAEKTCRICLDSTSQPKNKIISPCKCRGSMGYTHEECLKTWIVSKNKLIIGTMCEICKYQYLMKYEVKKVCMPIVGCRNNKGNGSVLICLIIVFSFLLSLQVLVMMQIVVIFSINNSSSSSNSNYSSSSISSSSSSGSSSIKNSPVVMIGFCIFLFLLLVPLLVFLVLIVRQISLVKKLKFWNIEERNQTPLGLQSLQSQADQQNQSQILNNNISVDNILNEIQNQDFQHPGIIQYQNNDNDGSSQKSFFELQKKEQKSLLSNCSKHSIQSIEEIFSGINPKFQQNRKPNQKKINQSLPMNVFLDAQYDEEDSDIQIIR